MEIIIKKRKLIVSIGITVTALVLIFLLKFTYELVDSPINKAIQHPNDLIIVYRPNCSRCQETLPRLLPRLVFSTHRDYLVDANHVSESQMQKIKVTLTPAFKYHSDTEQTINKKKIDKIWQESH